MIGMWVQTPYGFTSAVAHRTKKNSVLVRARDRQSLEYFCDAAGLHRNKIHMNMPSDYPFRVIAKRKTYDKFLLASAADITYDNFKNRAAQVRGKNSAYVKFLHKVWSAGHSLTPLDVSRKNNAAWAKHDRQWGRGGGYGTLWDSYGGKTSNDTQLHVPTLDDLLAMPDDERLDTLIDLETDGVDNADAQALLDDYDTYLAERDTKSVHDYTEAEWKELMEENPSGI